MFLSRLPIALAICVLACSYRDVKGDRRVQRTFAVTAIAASPFELVLAPSDCATESVVVTPSRKDKRTSRHTADLACLGKLRAGDTVELAKQREKQGCTPGMVYYDKLGECALGDLELTPRGTPCVPAAGMGQPRSMP